MSNDDKTARMARFPADNKIVRDAQLLPPAEMPRRQLARRLGDAAVSGIPFVGPFMTALYSVTHPEKSDLARAEWEKLVTDRVNFVFERVLPAIKLSDFAIDVAIDLARSSTRGFAKSESFDHAGIHATFPDRSFAEIKAACGELELDGFITVQHFLGGVSLIWPTNALFWIFDPLAFDGADPHVDAKALAQEACTEGYISSEKFASSHGWSHRRFNPALTLLLETTGSKGVIVSRTIDEHFYTLQVMIQDVAKAKLRREFELL